MIMLYFFSIFNQGVQEEVRKVNKQDAKNASGGGAKTAGVVIVSGVAKKKQDKKKGELIEQNQDGLEVLNRASTLFNFYWVLYIGLM